MASNIVDLHLIRTEGDGDFSIPISVVFVWSTRYHLFRTERSICHVWLAIDSPLRGQKWRSSLPVKLTTRKIIVIDESSRLHRMNSKSIIIISTEMNTVRFINEEMFKQWIHDHLLSSSTSYGTKFSPTSWSFDEKGETIGSISIGGPSRLLFGGPLCPIMV